MISFLRKITATSPRISKSKYYNDLEIPAKLFFDVLEDGDLNKLIVSGSPAEEELIDAWDNIFDKYFEAREDAKMRLILKKQATISLTARKIESFRDYTYILFNNPFNKEQLLEIVEALKKAGLRISIKNELKKEILRVLKITIPSLEIQLKLDTQNLKELTKGKKQKFVDALASMTLAGGVKLNNDVTLAFYIAYEKQLRKKE